MPRQSYTFNINKVIQAGSLRLAIEKYPGIVPFVYSIEYDASAGTLAIEMTDSLTQGELFNLTQVVLDHDPGTEFSKGDATFQEELYGAAGYLERVASYADAALTQKVKEVSYEFVRDRIIAQVTRSFDSNGNITREFREEFSQERLSSGKIRRVTKLT